MHAYRCIPMHTDAYAYRCTSLHMHTYIPMHTDEYACIPMLVAAGTDAYRCTCMQSCMQYRCNTHAIPMHMTCNTYIHIIHIHTHMHTRLTWQPLPRKAHPLHLSAPVRTHPDQPANRQKPARRSAKARFDSAKHVSLGQNTLFWDKTKLFKTKQTISRRNTPF